MWLRLHLFLVLLAIACSSGEQNPQELLPLQNEDGGPLTPADLSEDARRKLEAIGYLSGTEPAPDKSGVLIYDPQRAHAGTNLCVSGFGQAAFLMNMKGEILHEWAYNNNQTKSEKAMRGLPLYWRRIHLFPNGDVLSQLDHQSLIKLDKNSKLIWEYPERTHHDFTVLDDGSILVLIAAHTTANGVFDGRSVIEDFIVRLSPDGKETQRISLVRALVNGKQHALIDEIKAGLTGGALPVDITHTNSIKQLDGTLSDRLRAFRAGNVLLSVPRTNVLMILDLDQESVVWSMKGSFKYQHDARQLENGNLLVFDNRGVENQSAVLELDPRTGREVWAYRGTPDAPFFSRFSGMSHRLPNGNTLVIEAQTGRAFEVTPTRDIVWEFVNPRVVKGFVAILNDVVRIPSDFPLGWLDGVDREGLIVGGVLVCLRWPEEEGGVV